MSFNKDNFIPTSTSANSNAGKVFQYKDDKTLNEMLVPGYFNLAAESYGLKDKDVVMLIGNDGVSTSQAAVTDGAEVTLTGSVNGLRVSELSNSNNRQKSVVGFGDSLTAFTNGFIKWFVYGSDGAFIFRLNAGVAGNTTQNMLDRLDDIPAGSSIVTVMEGTNDASASVTPLQHGINIKAILVEMLNAGHSPILILAPPINDAAETLLVSEYNLYDWKSANDLGVQCFNVWDSSSDGLGFWAAGTNIDDFHPTNETEKTTGLSLYDNLKNTKFGLPLNRNNNFGIIPNSLMIDDGNTDGVPDNFVKNAGVTTLTDTSLGLGNTFNIVASEFAFLRTDTFNIEVGKRYLFACRVLINAITSTTNLDVYLEGQNDSIRYYAIDGATVTMGATTVSVEFTATDTDMRMLMIGSGSGINFDASLAQITLTPLDDVTVPSGAEYTVNGETRSLL